MMELTKRQMDIVNAAIRIIARKGYRELTIKNLAKSLALTEAALYRHFESKHELIRGILAYFETLSCRVLQDLRDEDVSPLEKIKSFVLDRYRLFVQNPDLGKVMFSEELFKNDPIFSSDMLSIMHIHRDEIIRYLKEGQVLGILRKDIRNIDIFRIVVGSMRLTITQWNLTNYGFDLIEEGTKLWNTIENMIKEPI